MHLSDNWTLPQSSRPPRKVIAPEEASLLYRAKTPSGQDLNGCRLITNCIILAQLRTLPTIAFECERKEAPKRLGVKHVTILDLLVRGNGGGNGKASQSRQIEFRDVEPEDRPFEASPRKAGGHHG
jgi:hypothetical protein